MGNSSQTTPNNVVKFTPKDPSSTDPIMEYCGECLRDGVHRRYPACLEGNDDN